MKSPKHKRRFWSEAEDRKLRRLWPHKPDAEVAKSFWRRTVPACSDRAQRLGLHKTEAFKRKYSKRYLKGFTPWNKGKKGVNGYSSSRFTKGHKPQTWKPLGSEKFKDGVLYRKVTDTGSKKDWRAVHVMIWESVHGPLPEGKVVIFADRNKANFSPENLIAVTRAENMERNSYHRYPQPIPKLIQLKGALQRQINRRDREKHRHA